MTDTPNAARPDTADADGIVAATSRPFPSAAEPGTDDTETIGGVDYGEVELVPLTRVDDVTGTDRRNDLDGLYEVPFLDDAVGLVDASTDASTQVANVIVDDAVDLAPVVHDALVLALPLSPLCRVDCPGPSPDAYPVTVADDAAQTAARDDRWAALDAVTFDDGEPADGP